MLKCAKSMLSYKYQLEDSQYETASISHHKFKDIILKQLFFVLLVTV